MKTRLIKLVGLILGLWLMPVIVAIAAGPVLQYTGTIPQAHNVAPGQAQTVTYSLLNNSTINQPITISLTPSNYDTYTITNNCPGSIVPPSSTCSFDVNLIAGNQAAENVGHFVSVNIGGSKPSSLPNQSIIYTIVGSAPVAALTVANPIPAVTDLVVGEDASTYVYTISNAANAAAADVQTIEVINSDDLENQMSYTSTTCSAALPAGASCTATVTATPTIAVTDATTQLSVVYNTVGNSGSTQTAVSSIATFSILPGPVVTVSTPTPAISDMIVGDAAQDYTYTISNAVDAGTAYISFDHIKANISANLQGQAVYNPSKTTCVASPGNSTITELAPGASCQAVITITPTQPVTNATVNMGVFYGPSETQSMKSIAYSPTSTFNITANPNMRTITFVNNCATTTIWYGISPSSPNSKWASAPTNPSQCRDDTDCYAGQTCTLVNSSSGLKQCYWNVPAISNYQLAPSQTTTISLPATYANNAQPDGIIWGGTFAARTGCTAAGCETADCSHAGAVDARGACAPGYGFTNPYTTIEITLQSTHVNADYYDISLVNGGNLPVSIGPSNVSQTSDNPYQCGIAGGVSDNKGLGGSDWNFNPPSDFYKYVSDGGAACTDGSNTCSASQYCGLSMASIMATASGATPALTCGKLLGYWTANQVCSYHYDTAPIGAPFNCATPAGMEAPFQALSLFNLYECANDFVPASSHTPAIPSCYSGDAAKYPAQCCGCKDWWNASIPTPAAYENACLDANPVWISNVLNTVEWLKQSVPSAYVFPYDDAGSTFTCTNATDSTPANTTNYTVTFCPQGAAGDTPF